MRSQMVPRLDDSVPAPGRDVLEPTTRDNGRIYGMKTTIDSAGRVVIPKAFRLRLGLTGGETLQIRELDGRLELELAPTPMTLETRDGVLVAVPTEDLPELTDEDVRESLERSRR